MPKLDKGATPEDFKKALDIVDKEAYDQARAIAKKHGLKFSQDTSLDKKGDWSTLLELEHPGETSDYRVGWSCSMSSDYSKPGCARIWNIVQNIETHKWQQDIKENVPLAKLAAEVKKSLEWFGKKLDAHGDIDIKEYGKKSNKLKYDWDSDNSGGDYIYATDFGADNGITATVYSWGEAAFEIDGEEEEFEFGSGVLDTKQKMEKHYDTKLKDAPKKPRKKK